MEVVIKFSSYILEVASKPGLFRIENVEDIGTIFFTYEACCNQNNFEVGTEINQFTYAFRCYVNRQFHYKGDKHDWVRLIRFHSSNNRHSIEVFISLFKRFLDKYLKELDSARG